MGSRLVAMAPSECRENADPLGLCQHQGAGPFAEPGGDADPANPQLHIPPSLKVLDKGNATYWEARGDGGDISEAEIDWMTRQRQLVFSLPQLVLDYGEAGASQIGEAVENAGIPRTVAGALAWPGVGTRWRRFIAWWRGLPQAERPMDAREALAGFARALGRVRTFRALALDGAGLQRILREDEIFPSGRLRSGVDAAYLRNIVETHGVAKIAVVRLFISHMPNLGGVDPSISLHDDWQTTSLIASGYASAGKRVHLFELSVPAIESLGWTLQEVAERSGPYLGPEYSKHEPWFCFPSPAASNGTWFDATLQRTERYGLFSVPHLRNRLRRLYMFDSVAELGRAVAPFVADMALRHSAHPQGQVRWSTDPEGDSYAVRPGSPSVYLLSGKRLDIDLCDVTTAGDARSRIAAYLEAHESQVRMLRGDAELGDEELVGNDKLGVALVPQSYCYNNKHVKKILEKGVDEQGGFYHHWRIEYEVTQTQSTRTEEITEEIARKLIHDFNFKRCTKVVDFFWHGSSMPQDSHYYVPQETHGSDA